MKILYISYTGFADTDFPLIRALQNKGVDITYVLDVAPSTKKGTIINIEHLYPCNKLIHVNEYPELNLFKSYLKFDKFYILNRTKDRRLSFSRLIDELKFLAFIKKEKFDIVHTTHILWYFELLIFLFHSKTVLTVHDPFPHSGETYLRKSLFRWTSFKLSSKFVLLNNKQSDNFCKVYNISKNRLLVSRISVFDYLDVFRNVAPSPSANNILFYGRISPYKGIDYLCEAMIKVHQKLPNVTLTIAGSGKIYFDWTKYEKLPYIKLINKYLDMTDIVALLDSCAVVVCPYTDATQSGVVTTAFSMKKPVIATKVGGLDEMVIDGVTGFLVKPKDVDNLSETIINAMSNPHNLDNIKNHIEEIYFHGNNSWPLISEEYLKLYNSLLRKS